MSLTLALRTALSGLTHNQAAIQVTSNNVSNVNTEGYTRKTVDSMTRVLVGTGAGVFTTDLLRNVNESLLRDLRDQMTELGEFNVRDEFFTRMQDFFGTPSDSTSLTASLGTLAERMEALSAFPEDITRVQQVIDAATQLTNQLNGMARDIQGLRAQADQEISDSVNIVNIELNKIHQLNQEIARNIAIDKPIAELEDQRDRSLSTISEHIGISYFVRQTGEVTVTTKAGVTLLDVVPAPISHTPAGGVDASFTYPAGFDAINVNGVDITPNVGGGRIAELVAMRDTTLPNLQAQLDALSNALRDEINAIHNDGAGLPARNTLTGTLSGLAGPDAFAATGTVRIAVVDGTGNTVAAPLDLSLAGIATIGDLVTAIDTGLGGFGSASVDAQGRLVINATNASNGVVISEASSDVTATSRGFSHHFGLNDFFIGDNTVSIASNIGVRADIVADPSLLSRGSMAAPPAVIQAGQNVIAPGDGSVATRMAQKLAENISIPSAGALPPFTGNLIDYSAQILGSNAIDAAEAADGLSFRQTVFQDLEFRVSSQSGVNVDEEMAILVDLQSAYQANARVFTTAAEMIRILSEIGR
ncbi:MAG: flagellar hook-associated protein FlgK [Alphaproteobacteria bacterium]|nr:flagellar hook-associated protein FlgK [Alphaproteobacteria bacterium]